MNAVLPSILKHEKLCLCRRAHLKQTTRPKVYGHMTITPICDCYTSNFKTAAVNLFHSSGFRFFTRCWNLLRGFAPVQSQQHQWGPTLTLGDKVWLAVCAPVHSKAVGWGLRSGPVKLFHTKLGKKDFFMDLASGIVTGNHYHGLARLSTYFWPNGVCWHMQTVHTPSSENRRDRPAGQHHWPCE